MSFVDGFARLDVLKVLRFHFGFELVAFSLCSRPNDS
jgi:hypothetical protein